MYFRQLNIPTIFSLVWSHRLILKRGCSRTKEKLSVKLLSSKKMRIWVVKYWSLACINVFAPFSLILFNPNLLSMILKCFIHWKYRFLLLRLLWHHHDGGKKAQWCIGAPSGEIIDFIKRGFLLMLRLRNNGLANKQVYGPYIWQWFFDKFHQSFTCNGLMYPYST